MIYYKRKENLVFAKTAFICYFDNPSYYVARTFLYIQKELHSPKCTPI